MAVQNGHKDRKTIDNELKDNCERKLRGNSKETIDKTYLDGERIDIPDQGIDTGCFSLRKLWLYTGPGWLSKLCYIRYDLYQKVLRVQTFTNFLMA